MTTESTPAPSGTPSYGFDDPADNAIAHSIATKDPLRDLKGPVTLIGENVRLPQTVPLSALSPEMREPIQQQLAATPVHMRPTKEAELVAAALAKNSINLRVQGGGGEDTDPYWRETLHQERRQQELNDQINRLERELVDVERFDTVYDEVTGQPRAQAVDKVQGQARKEKEAERNRLIAELQDMNGRGGQLKLQKAMQKAVEAQKDVQRQLAEDAEAKVQADAQLRKERIDARAETYAKHRRNNF